MIRLYNGSTLKVAGGKDIIGLKLGNTVKIDGVEAGNGTLEFQRSGDSTINIQDGIVTTNALDVIKIGNGKVTSGLNTSNIKAYEFKFSRANSELALGAVAATVKS